MFIRELDNVGDRLIWVSSLKKSDIDTPRPLQSFIRVLTVGIVFLMKILFRLEYGISDSLASL